jgi:hypothetical protein
MITGVETAGLVLASFPIIVSVIQGYREGLKPIRNWYRYRKQLVELSSAVGCQNTIFENNIRRLLDPIVGADSSLMHRLLTGAGTECSEWADPTLREKLEARLSESYGSYLATVTAINETLKQLENELGMEIRGEKARAAVTCNT